MELPRLEPLWQSYREQGLRILAVESTGDPAGAVAFRDQQKLTYSFVQHREGEKVAQEIFHVASFPTTYLVDRQGRVLYSHFGFTEGHEHVLEAEIQKLLEL